MKTRRLSLFFMMMSVVLLSHPISLPAAGKPEVTRHEAHFLESAVNIHIQWQSPNPVTLVKISVANINKEIKVDEYDNKRNRDGYAGEVSVVLNLDLAPAQSFVYVIQLEDELRMKSSLITGKVKVTQAQQPGIMPPPPGAIPQAGLPQPGMPQATIQQEGTPQTTTQQEATTQTSIPQIGVPPGGQILKRRQQPAEKSGDAVDKAIGVLERYDRAPNLGELKVNRLGVDTISISTKANDDKGLREINFVILDSAGNQADTQTITNLGRIWQGTSKAFKLPPGKYIIVVQAVDTAGNTSPERKASLAIEGSGITTPASGAVGSLSVILSPQPAIDGGAMWRVDNGPWQKSGGTISNLSVGPHTVDFMEVSNWIRPENQNVQIENAMTMTVNGTYNQ
jgi:hypothetical protein